MTGAPEILPTPVEEIPHIILREQAWKDYYERKKERICSRCGQYSKYEIISSSHTTNIGLRNANNEEFYEIEYKINTTPIINKNSNDSTWGNLCNRCRDHTLGLKAYPLSSSKVDTEDELTRLKSRERVRQTFQDDDIKKAKTKLNKERREGDIPVKKPSRAGNPTNPNDQQK